jgi:hypothetical protein
MIRNDQVRDDPGSPQGGKNGGKSGKLWTFFANVPLPKIAVFSLFSTLNGQTLQ